MFHIAICDDEEYFRIREKNIISKYMEKNKMRYEIDLFSSGQELLSMNNMASKYNMIFLDVNMEKMDGIETARRIRKFSKDVYLVFVTAFVTYALEGYKVDAIRYIIKDDDCLEKTIEECMETILYKINYVEEKKQFAFQEGVKEIILDDILYVESNLHKLTFWLQGKNFFKYSMYEKLDVIAELLKPYNFCRIHKSYLVNLKYVEMMERYQLRLYNGVQLNIAKPRYPEVRNEFIAYRGDI